jgi:hypothetical protein
MHAQVTADAQRNQRALFTIHGPMMNQQPRARAAGPAAATIAFQYTLAQATEKAQRMLPPVIARAAAPQPL